MALDYTSSFLRMAVLKPENWSAWKTKVTSLMTLQKLRHHLENDAPASSSTKTLEEVKKEEDLWMEDEEKVMALLRLVVSDSELYHFTGATTAKKMWKNLCDVHEPRGHLAILSARKRLFRMVAVDGKPMSEHIVAFREAMDKLNSMTNEYPISDREFALLLITSLPDSWDVFITSFFGHKADSKSLITSSELIEILIQEDRRRNERSSNNEVAHATQHRKQQPQFSKKSSGTKCGNCSKGGHSKEDCWSKGGGKEGQGPRQKDKTTKSKPESINQVNNLPDMAYQTHQANLAFQKNDWIADSGASCHIATDKSMFQTFEEHSTTISGFSEGMSISSLGTGTVILNSHVDGKIIPVTLKNVMYSPSAVNCLLSISRIDSSGGSAEYGNEKVTLRDRHGEVMTQGMLHNKVYLLSAKAICHPTRQETINFAKHKRAWSWDEWHRALGHLAISSIKRLAKSKMVTGLDIDPNSQPSLSCEACIKGKATHTKFPKETSSRHHQPGDLTYSDLWGPAHTPSLGGGIYYITFTDDATRRCTVKFLKRKPDALQEIKNYVSLVENQRGVTPKILRFDNGTKFVNKEVKAFCSDRGIKIQTTAFKQRHHIHINNMVLQKDSIVL
ncbi:unnamed protein product [Calypogeia fissa]